MHAEALGEARVPVLLVAGAPGAGKSSLVARWLEEPGFANAAVVVNELGEASLDAHLVRAVVGHTHAVEGGCACCTARRALAGALAALGERSGAPHAERVVVELAGTAHPLPVLEDLASEPRLAGRFALHGVVTVVDGEAGLATLEGSEAHAQVAAADALVISKAESLAPADGTRLAARLARINPDASIFPSPGDGAEGYLLWDAVAGAPGREVRHLEAALAAGPEGDEPHESLAAMHGAGIGVHTVRLERNVELSEYCVRLASFLEAHGDAVLRVKGLVGVRGRRGPAVIQAVRRTLHPVRALKAWPPEAAPGALVVVARGLESEAIRAALRA
jgi:G3E family GTPase